MSRAGSRSRKSFQRAPGFLLLLGLLGGPVEAAGVAYEKKYLMRATVHVITVDLNNPGVRVTPFVAQGFPSAAEDFASMIRRAQPVAAINAGYGTMAALCASVGLIYYRQHPWLSLLADWTWRRLLLLSGGRGFSTGLRLGLLLSRLQARGTG